MTEYNITESDGIRYLNFDNLQIPIYLLDMYALVYDLPPLDDLELTKAEQQALKAYNIQQQEAPDGFRKEPIIDIPYYGFNTGNPDIEDLYNSAGIELE